MNIENNVYESHLSFFVLFAEFIKEVANLFKYIFKGIFLGKAP